MEGQLEQCEKHKTQGNDHLKANNFQSAVESYTKAIEHVKQNVPANKAAVYFANRAFAHIKMENYGLAIPDAQQSIKLSPNYEKAYWRLAFAKEILQNYKEAYNAYKKAFELSGNKDQTIYNKLVHCKKMGDEAFKRKKQQILHDDKQRGPKLEKPYKNWRQIDVEKDYNGPKLEQDQEVTIEWVEKLMEHYKDQKSLHKRYTLQLIEKCRDRLRSYQSLVEFPIQDQEEFNVCGDIHGQYYDVMNIFKTFGNPSPHNKFLFNGDFVDRGSFSVECIMTLIAWKCANNDILHMTRGNHECKQVNMIYGFKGETEAKFNKDMGVYQAFSEMFCCLPLAYVLNKKVMVCHGGLPVQDNVKLSDIKEINRFIQIPDRGIMCDLLWADPINTNGRQPSKRGVSMGFGPDISKKFLEDNDLCNFLGYISELLIRSHESKAQGYEEQHDGRVVTIFSAPNYCDFQGNKGAIIKLKGKQMKPKYLQFTYVPHPNVGPMAYAKQFQGMM